MRHFLSPWKTLGTLAWVLLALSRVTAADLTTEYEARNYRGSDGTILPYRLLKPKQVEPGRVYPLVLFLHGAGERGHNNLSQLTSIPAKFASDENRAKYPCFVLAPQCFWNKRWVDTPWGAKAHVMPEKPTPHMLAALELVEASVKEFPVDAARIYVTGLSMGGYGVWDAIQRRPDLFAAAVPICGGGDETRAAAIAKVPVWVFHGGKDGTVPLLRSRNMVAALKKAGGAPKYTEYPDVGHDAWTPAFNEPELLPWLFAHKRERPRMKLANVIGSHMVLQRDQPLPIWGTAEPGEEVSVRLDGGPPAAAKTDAQGRWKVVLPAVKADGKPHRMTVCGQTKIELDDILIGEVWLGSGQSNMGCPYDAPQALAAADLSHVRLFQVPFTNSPTWQVAEREYLAKKFSGPLAYFGLRLQKELGVPIGLIHAAEGGSKIELWTAQEGTSARLYREMIAPLVPVAMRGAVWYQGEANNQDGVRYAPKMKALIEGWRQAWGREFPFYFVQIAPFSYDPYCDLKFLWEAQAAALKVPRTGIVVTTDLVEDLDDIHAVNKFEVGNRLALWALAKDYGRKDLAYSGPLYKGMKIEGSKVRLYFAHAAGLKSRDGKPLTHFEIAGPDGKLADAEATIEGETVLVSAKEVPSPALVWFGWHNVVDPNLVNRAGLPALPFQSKDWKGGAAE